MSSKSKSIAKYQLHLTETMSWLGRTVKPEGRGSSAVLWASGKWSDAYPETTGYIITTMLDYAKFSGADLYREQAITLGDWLLDIQSPDGFWHGGTHPVKAPNPSVFNTAQILIGLCSLYHQSNDNKWLESLTAGAKWLESSVDSSGNCSLGNYQEGFTPSYYTRVAWPMLEASRITNDQQVRDAAERILEAIKDRATSNGSIAGWGFKPDEPAFTHTIAYTLRGFIECANLSDNWDQWGQVCEKGINKLARKSELSHGRLPGDFDKNWKGNSKYTCLTGNAQLAICFLKLHLREPDLRLVNAASKLLDFNCSKQSLRHPLASFRGAISGSRPLWGRYMTMRYPNWAAKFHADALMLLIESLQREGLK